MPNRPSRGENWRFSAFFQDHPSREPARVAKATGRTDNWFDSKQTTPGRTERNGWPRYLATRERPLHRIMSVLRGDDQDFEGPRAVDAFDPVELDVRSCGGAGDECDRSELSIAAACSLATASGTSPTTWSSRMTQRW